MKKTLKVLHAPTTVGGNPSGLSRAFSALGIKSSVVALSQTYLNYHADRVIWEAGDNLLVRELKRLKAILTVLPGCDVVQYNFGTTFATPYPAESGQSRLRSIFVRLHCLYLGFLQWFELNMLKILGIPAFVIYQGDDARQGNYCMEHFKYSIAAHVDEGYYSEASDSFKRKSIRRMAKYCQGIYSVNPDLLYVLPANARFTPYAHVFADEIEPNYCQYENRPLRILHAPTSRQAKGTPLILEALDSLEKQGYEFELVLIEGMSNEEAQRAYRNADVLIDQLYAGWYGGLAVEVMAMGKPVLVYLREADLDFIPVEMKSDLPFIQITPDDVELRLKHVMEMSREELVELGRRSRAFAEKWHNPEVIASELREDYLRSLNIKN